MPSIRTFLQRSKSWGEFVGFFALIFGAVYGINAYVDWRIDQKLSDEQFLRKVGVSARPFCIFNNKGSILFDSGAMQFIDHLGKNPVEFSDLTKDGKPQRITVHFNRLFDYPPALSVIGDGLATNKPERGQGFDFIYSLYYADALISEAYPSAPPSTEQDFKLEILY